MADIDVLLKGPLVQQFLAGKKTQTRRLDLAKWRRAKPGDRIWFKETTLRVEEHGYVGPVFEASEQGASILEWGLRPDPDDYAEVEPHDIKRRPSIFMFKEWCRCWAVIEDIREEPLQDITTGDAIAEGVGCWVCGGPVDSSSENDCGCFHSKQMARDSFAVLWDSINSKPGQRWADNPIVAVVTFRRIEVPRG